MGPDDNQIRTAASHFRSALDAIDSRHWHQISINNFPRGACGHCSELLARYLQERLGVTPDYVCHNLESGDGKFECGHAWLEWNGLLIDISGDQFGWPPVTVTRTPDEAYRRSQAEVRHPWKLDQLWWARQCNAIWNAVQPLLRDD